MPHDARGLLKKTASIVLASFRPSLAAALLAVFFSSPLWDDVADQVIHRRIGDLDLDDVPCHG